MKIMEWTSTRRKSNPVSFEEAVRSGLAPDGGLYMPAVIERLPDSFWKKIQDQSFQDMAFEVASHFLRGGLPEEELRKIVNHTLTFDAPLYRLDEGLYTLELFHGPTLAFKDFGARFLAGVLGYFATQRKHEITILVATSGDTGSAVAHGFLGVAGTKVMVLFPSGRVSDLQERQFTTLGENITALEIDGSFDDCQRLVKMAFSDHEITKSKTLTSANSINVARLIPQMFYYFRACQQLPEAARRELVVSVPSGNFGNLTAGLMAKKLGLPVSVFVASTNVNDIVPEFLHSGIFNPRHSVSTISNAMDVGNPSNFERLLALYEEDPALLAKDVKGYAFSDEETKEGMHELDSRYHYVADPHGAVGFLGLKKFNARHERPLRGVFLETAHPAKFRETVAQVLGRDIEIPERLSKLIPKEKVTKKMSKSFTDFKAYLLQ